MEKEQINSNTPAVLPQRHNWPRRHKLLLRYGIILIVVLLLLSPFFVAGAIFKQAGVSGYAETVKSFLFSKESGVKSENGRVNILILGIGGKGHAGADLTDTMIFGSLSLTNHSITLISVPRDIWIPEIRAKINSAYHWGNLQPDRGGGLAFAKQIVSRVTGQTVDYALVIDFSGFRDIIDTMGGINVSVDNSFTDTKYPIAGKEDDTCGGDPTFACRYKTIHFDKSIAHMDGATALEFARSREGDNGENTDFARSVRQQKIISAISKKVLSFGTIINPFKDYKILLAVKASVETDLNPTAIGILARVVLGSRNNINSQVLPTDLFMNPPITPSYDNQYVLIPKPGNGKWGDLQQWFKSLQ
ncbi:MAG: LCP family protein [Candidatus Woesebacteria bacterium]|nr:LCP family protein [Candidatus Woesebacteria bacterium]